MNRSEFLEKLSAQLRRRNIADAEDIMEEYRQHFNFKLAEGHTEEEIAAKLGDPKAVAAQYETVPLERKSSNRVAAIIGLGLADFGFGLLCLILYPWGLVIGCFALSSGLLSLGLIFDLGRFEHFYLPEMPYHCALAFGLAFAALAILVAVGTIYFFRLISYLIRAFRRFHKKTLGRAQGGDVPLSGAKPRPALRRLCLFAAAAFVLFLTAGFILSIISSGQVGFWHAWGWFGYGA